MLAAYILTNACLVCVGIKYQSECTVSELTWHNNFLISAF